MSPTGVSNSLRQRFICAGKSRHCDHRGEIRQRSAVVTRVVMTVSQMGGNTYQVNAQSRSAYEAKVAALEAAKRTCADAQREVLITNIDQTGERATILTVTAVTFQCRNHGDPALLNPTYTAPPSAVIEDQR